MKMIRSLLMAAILACGGLTLAEPLAAPAFAQQAKAPQLDRAFIDRMVPHHQMGVAMADMAIQHAQHAELKAFAQRMKATQEKDIKEMKSWRAQWFGSADTPPMDRSMMPELPHGAEFDERWAQLIMMHHQGAIAMSRMLDSSPGQSKLRQKARTMSAQQEKEQKELQTMLERWKK